MKVQIEKPKYKEITFETYQKYFLEALKPTDTMEWKILFYKKLPEGIQISFSWDNFIILVFVKYCDILKIYENQNLNVADVTLSDKEDNPILLKFYAEFMFNRGIEEV